jgi:ribokinase
MLDVVAVGDVMLDVLGPPVGRGRTHGAVRVRAGGSAVNVARAAAQLGARAAVVGRVGGDAAGRAIADELARLGVVALLELDREHETGTTVYLGEDVVAGRGANAHIEAAELPPARATIVSGYLEVATVRDVLGRAGGLRAVDLQGAAHHGFRADVVIGPGLALDELASRHGVVCSTLGARGAIAVAEGVRAEAAPPRVLERSPVGAGDAFAAAFVLALADGLPLQASLERGCAAAVGVEP